jgi:formylglycine-generating enzyme required for sulfatase activity
MLRRAATLNVVLRCLWIALAVTFWCLEPAAAEPGRSPLKPKAGTIAKRGPLPEPSGQPTKAFALRVETTGPQTLFLVEIDGIPHASVVLVANPARVVIDPNGRLPAGMRCMDGADGVRRIVVQAGKIVPSPLAGEGQGGGDTAASELPPTVQTTPTPNPSPQGGGGRERRAPSPNRPADDHLPIGAIFSDAAPGWAPEMVVVPPGTFWMGSKDGEGDKDERPRHEVTIGYRLAVGRTPVTFEEWDACFNNGGTKHKPETKWGRGRKPVHSVSWDDITKHYLPWLNRKLGLSGPSAYRLLTEAEWEYCCRAGTETAYSFGDTITEEQAQFLAKQTVEVGTFPSNAFGLHDMHGNLWEWCEDAWATDYTGAPADGSARTSADESISRVLRGGSWDDLPQDLRSAQRDVSRPGSRSSYLGFRLARTLSHSP